MKLKSIIVEDEPMASKALERMCEKSKHVELLANYENAEKVLEHFADLDIQLIFLDIEMPGLSGLELLDKLPYLPQIIFTTSNVEYAFQAFEYDVTDFLKKPIIPGRFEKAVEKAIQIEERYNAINLESAKHELFIKTDGKYIRVPYSEILYFENVGDYVKVITEKLGTQVIYGALKSIDERLNYPRFLKVHRSFIVNLEKIVDIEDNTLVIGKKVIPISRAHKPILLKNINIL